jgi:hypothetical protein
MCKKLLLLVLVIGLAAGAVLGAPTPVTVANFSFELPGTVKMHCWDGEMTGTIDVPGWTDGTLAATDSGVESSTSYPATDGTWTGFQRGSDPNVYNLTNFLIGSGDVFELQVDAMSTWQGVNFKICLYYDNNGQRVTAAVNNATITGSMATYSLTFTADTVPACYDHEIGIEFDNTTTTYPATNSWDGFDNVRLNVTSNLYRAMNPYPAHKGFYEGTSVTLTWTPGTDLPTSPVPTYKVYLDQDRTKVDNSTAVFQSTRDVNNCDVSGIVQGQTYYWRIDTVSGANTYRGSTWKFTTIPQIAYSPDPATGAIKVPVGPIIRGQISPLLSWQKGTGAVKGHRVYFSDSFDAVNNAATGSSTSPPFRTYLSDANDVNWAPSESGLIPLATSKTYYWRIDTVQSTSPQIIYKGTVWSFTTVPIPGLGFITREVWEGITGTTIADLTGDANYPDNPTTTSYPTSFDAPRFWGDNYGTRMYGWLYIEDTNDYTFWLNSDDAGELWLNNELIASESTNNGYHNWPESEQSAPIHLEKDNLYYIMALQKEGTGGDHLAVAWSTSTDDSTAQLIPGTSLLPFHMYAMAGAYNPKPANEAEYVATDVNLVWSAGAKAKFHDVYFGTNPDSLPLVSYRQTATTYDPALANDTTYYWRIDEVNDTPSLTIWPGEVWSFTTRPDIPITDPNLIGWWKLDDDEGTIAVDWSGYYNRGTLMPDVNGPVWTDGILGGALQFDGIDDYVNCGNAASLNEPNRTGQVTLSAWVKTNDCGNGQHNEYIAKGDHSYAIKHFSGNNIQFFIYDGTWYTANYPVDSSFNGTWHHLAGTYDGSQLKLYIDGELKATTAHVGHIASETANVNLGRNTDVTDRLYEGALDDVRIYNRALSQGELIKAAIPSVAWRPRPNAGATDAEPTLTLIWNPGNKAAEHDVYFSDNFDDVNDANSLDQSGPTEIYRGQQDANDYIIPETLEWGQTYYWRIDEVNDPNFWRGDIWSFTVRNYLPVDDFESYTNSDPHIIYKTWKDGVGYSPGNGTGSQVGYRDPNYVELTIIHGGRQSMPFDYNNLKSPYYSEADRTFDSPQNWTASGPYSLKSLTLWFRGYPVSVGSFVESPVGTYTIAASGANIGDVSPTRGGGFHDEFHFGYKAATSGTDTTLPTGGTFTGVKIIAKVESLGNTGDTVGKAGVMIRDSLDASSVNGFMCVRRIAADTYGVAFQYRLAQGGSTTQDVNDTGITLPCWVAITLQTASGSRNVRAYYSKNGTTWLQLGTVQQYPSGTMYLPKPGSAPIYMGLAATPQSNTATRIAKFSSVSITAGAAGGWNHQDIGIKSNVASPLYVTLQDSKTPTPGTKTITHSDPNIILQNTWQAWDIALSDFNGVDLKKIKKITIGVGNRSAPQAVGIGTIYVDDIRLYVPRCIAGRVAPDFTGSDCLVDNQDLQILTNNWLISEYQVMPTTPGDANLVAYYKFDGDFKDSSNGNDGEPNEATIVNDPVRGLVADFNGISDYVNCSNDVSLDITGKITLSLWVKTNDAGNSQDNEWVAKGDHTYAIKHKANNNIEFFIYDGAWYTAWYAVNSSFNGVWHHVAGTYDGSALKLYVDGVLQATTAHVGRIETRTHNLYMGENSESTGRFYAGAMDEVRIYSRALSQDEVAWLAEKTTPFTQPLSGLLTNPAVNLNNDGRIDIRDYAILASKWLETLLWPQQ